MIFSEKDNGFEEGQKRQIASDSLGLGFMAKDPQLEKVRG